MREIVYKYALKNALDYGRAEPRAVLGKVLKEKPGLRESIKELLPLLEEVVREVNSLSPEKRRDEIKKYEFLERKKEKKALPELPRVGKVVLRFAPNPSGPLHLGHCRAALLNDEYARRYGGRLILRFEDTDPARVDPNAYAMVEEDLRWLGVDYHEVAVQSERLEFYYEYAEKLLEGGNAYVCTCSQEKFQRLRNAGRACECRDREVKENLQEYSRMFAEYKEGEAVVRLKTSLTLPDPAMRDFIIMRIREKPHPRVKGKRVYPLYNFAVVVDDHLMGITHVLRGKDHLINTRKQGYIYDYLSWPKPEFIHYGLMKVEGLELSTSLIARGIREGRYRGWGDLRLGTLQALRRRGIRPEAIRRAIVDVGVKSTDISFSWKNLYAYNKELVDRVARRYFFVPEPKLLVIKNPERVKKAYYAPMHPDRPELGKRELRFNLAQGYASTYIAGEDYKKLKKGGVIRLMDAFNVEVLGKERNRVEVKFHSEALEEARRLKAPLLQWASQLRVEVEMPDGGTVKGYGEAGLRRASIGDVVQFERFGFVRIDKTGEPLVACFAHR
jgi:glutamyl-tRNA synthetase